MEEKGEGLLFDDHLLGRFNLGVLCLSTSERVLILLEGDVVILQDVGDLLGLRSFDDLLLGLVLLLLFDLFDIEVGGSISILKKKLRSAIRFESSVNDPSKF